jgi:hypothetical protein
MSNPADWHREAHAGWVIALLHEFGRLQAAYPELADLRPPNLRVSEALTRTLGQWDEDSRCISLAAWLFERARWQDIIDVFHHEIAHQIVSELYGIRHAMPHGEAFQRACRLLGIPAETTRALAPDEAPAHAESGAMRRIRKLLALGDSPNRHEAEQALAKAHALMLKHNIKQQEMLPPEGYTLRIVGQPFKRMPSYIWAIANIVSDYYFVLYIANRYVPVHPDYDGNVYQQIEFYGTAENLDLAEYVFYFLLHQGKREWARYKEANQLPNNRRRLAFLRGLYTGVAEKLAAERQTLADQHALVWLGDPRLDAFYRERNPRVSSRRSYTRLNADAHADGAAVGARLRLAKGVTGAATRRGRLLPE